MRAIDPALQASLDGGATTLCRCWRLRRQDGVILGFTDHDQTLFFEETAFRASTGLDASALQVTNGLAVDNAQVTGALTDAAITEDDVRAGRYDHAEVDHWLVDWRNPDLRVHLFRGHLGEIRRTDAVFEAELRGLSDLLNVPVGRTMNRACDRVVGDSKCGVDLDDPRFRHETTVAAVARAGRLEIEDAGDFPSGWFVGGVLRWLTGRNEGLVGVIRAETLDKGTRQLQLASEPALGMVAGDRLLLTAGCDRSARTCREKFGNFLNFRGFPHIPGEDWVVAYPKQGQAHDGSRLDRA
jgi:uncharacterized phage protein (TIGR02218 family)